MWQFCFRCVISDFCHISEAMPPSPPHLPFEQVIAALGINQHLLTAIGARHQKAFLTMPFAAGAALGKIEMLKSKHKSLSQQLSCPKR